jgi:NADH-quinone oxidoreductase subunit H
MDPVSGTAFVLFTAGKVVVFFTLAFVIVALATMVERKVAGFIQDRSGPNRVGPWGLLQVVADGLKNILKEETMPEQSIRPFFLLAPAIAMIPATILFAVLPFASPLPTQWGLVEMIVADVPIGFLWVLAIGSLGVYGLVMAGWASGSKYAFLGGLRGSAQMVSYEVALALSLFFFFISGLAETNRLPFDLPEAEAELVTGYHTEYSAMKFSMFMLGEFFHIITVAALVTVFFLGGWDIPFWGGDNIRVLADGTVIGDPTWWKTLLTACSFAIKMWLIVVLFVWIRWTLPRFRYDQLMDLGWKFMLEAVTVYILVIALTILLIEGAGIQMGLTYAAILFGVNAVLAVLVFFVLDRGTLIRGGGYRTRLAERRRVDERHRARHAEHEEEVE